MQPSGSPLRQLHESGPIGRDEDMEYGGMSAKSFGYLVENILPLSNAESAAINLWPMLHELPR